MELNLLIEMYSIANGGKLELIGIIKPIIHIPKDGNIVYIILIISIRIIIGVIIQKEILFNH